MEAAGGLTGTKVVVHVYPNHDDQRFVDAVKSAQQTLYVKIILTKPRIVSHSDITVTLTFWLHWDTPVGRKVLERLRTS